MRDGLWAITSRHNHLAGIIVFLQDFSSPARAKLIAARANDHSLNIDSALVEFGHAICGITRSHNDCDLSFRVLNSIAHQCR